MPSHLCVLLLATVIAIVAAAEPVLVVDGPRTVMDLAGTWEGVSTQLALSWPAPEAGSIVAHAVAAALGGVVPLPPGKVLAGAWALGCAVVGGRIIGRRA